MLSVVDNLEIEDVLEYREKLISVNHQRFWHLKLYFVYFNEKREIAEINIILTQFRCTVTNNKTNRLISAVHN